MFSSKLSFYYTLSRATFSPDYFPSLSKTIFPTEEEYQKFASIATIPSLICASPIIHEQDLSFKCLDCGRENEFHMICEPCFNHGYHEGHRFIYTMERGGCCDCGDIGAIDEMGFCSLHKGYEQIKKEEENSLEEKCNNKKDQDKNCIESEQEIIKKDGEEEKNGSSSFQNVLESLEMKNINKNEKMGEWLFLEKHGKNKNILEQSFKAEFFMMFESILIRIFELYEEDKKEEGIESNVLLANLFIFLEDIMKDHGAVGIWFSEFLMCNVADAHMNEFYHDCGSFKDLIIRSNKAKCQCSYLELLFRFNKSMNAELQKKMELFVYKLFPNKEFKKYLVKTYAKMLNFILYCGKKLDSDEIIFHISGLRTIYTQFFSEDLIELLFSFGFPEKNMDRLEIFLDAISQENQFKTANELLFSFYNIFFFLIERRPMFERKIMSSNFLERFIEIFARKRKFQTSNVDQIRHAIQMLAIGNNLIKEFIGIIYKEQGFIEKITQIIANLLDYSEKTYKDFDAKKLMDSEEIDFIYENDLRILGTLLGNLLVIIENFKEFSSIIEKIMPQSKRISIFILIFKRIYAMKYCRSEQRKNKFTNDDWFFLYQVISNLEAYEYVLIQIILALDGEHIIKVAFDDLTKIELKEKEPLSNDDNKTVEFFFNFIIDTITNETSLLVMTQAITIKQDLNDTRFVIMRNLFANFFICKPKIQFQTLIKLINKHVLRATLDSVISDNITHFAKLVPETKDFILKIEYNHIYEPFFWSKVAQLKSDYHERLQILTKKGILDVFLGSEAEYFSPIMKIIIEKLIVSKTYELLLKVIFGEITNNQNLIRYALKLLFYMISVNKSDLNINFVYEIKEYLNKLPGELQKLSELKENEYFQSSYRKFSNYLKEQTYYLEGIQKSFNINRNEETKNLDKKNEMKKNILMKFAKSRQNFIEYNIKPDDMEIEENKEFECCICHVSSVDDVKIICCFLSFDNLHLYHYGRKREGSPKCVINTCGHNFHKECLNKNLSNAYVEYKCPICKYILNFWAPNLEEYFHYENNFKESDSLTVAQIDEIIKSTSFTFVDGTKSAALSQHVKEFISQMLNEILISEVPNIYEYPSFSMVMLLDSLTNCSEKVFSYPLENFFQKEFDLSRNLYLLMKLHLFSEDCPIEYKKVLIQETLEMLDRLERIDLSLSFENFDSNFNELFWRVAALFIDQNDKNCLATLSFICKLMITKLIFIISLTLLTEPFESTLQIISLLESNHFRSQVLAYMQPYFNLIFGNLSIVFLNKRPEDLNESKTENFLILFTKYFPWIFALDKAFLDFWGTKWLPAFISLPKSSFKLLQNELHRNQGRKFEIIEISNNYMEFYSIHSKMKCSLCHYFPKTKNSFLALCLICGEMFCSRVCAGSKPLQIKGNLYRHAKKKHAGSTVFVDIADTKILLVCKRNVAIWDFLYFDNLGQNKNLKSLKWNQFLVSDENKEKIREVLSKKELKQFIVYFFHKAPKNVIMTDRF